jgi:hypothetical protein
MEHPPFEDASLHVQRGQTKTARKLTEPSVEHACGPSASPITCLFHSGSIESVKVWRHGHLITIGS